MLFRLMELRGLLVTSRRGLFGLLLLSSLVVTQCHSAVVEVKVKHTYAKLLLYLTSRSLSLPSCTLNINYIFSLHSIIGCPLTSELFGLLHLWRWSGGWRVLSLLPKATAKSPYQPTPDIPPLQRFPWGDIPTSPRRDEVCDLLEELPSLPGSNLASPYSRTTLPSDSLLYQKARRNRMRRLRRNSKPSRHSIRLWIVFQCQRSMEM